MPISSNAKDVFRRMQAREKALLPALAQVASQFAPIFQRETRGILNEKIYSVEIPLKASAQHGVSRVPTQLQPHVAAKPGTFATPLSQKVLAKYAGTSRQTHHGKEIRQWRRTGDLLQAEKARASGPNIILSNGMRYAVSRYNLGTPEGRSIQTPGVQSVQWHREAIEKLAPALREARRVAVYRVLMQR